MKGNQSDVLLKIYQKRQNIEDGKFPESTQSNIALEIDNKNIEKYLFADLITPEMYNRADQGTKTYFRLTPGSDIKKKIDRHERDLVSIFTSKANLTSKFYLKNLPEKMGEYCKSLNQAGINCNQYSTYKRIKSHYSNKILSHFAKNPLN